MSLNLVEKIYELGGVNKEGVNKVLSSLYCFKI